MRQGVPLLVGQIDVIDMQGVEEPVLHMPHIHLRMQGL